MMRIPLLDLKPQHNALRNELLDAIGRVIDSQQFVLGPEVQRFEDDVAKYTHTKHAIGCASGSDALLLALMALNIGKDDEVITSPFTFFATGAAITRLGARPVFVDIDPSTYTLDVSLVESAISDRTRAIIPVHLYGQCADMRRLLAISEQHKVPLIEDAAQALGARDQVWEAGAAGLAGCFSFYPSKNLGAIGDAGAVVTDDATMSERLRRLRVHGQTSEYHHAEVGINSRLDGLQAAVLSVKLKYLDRWSEARRAKAARYSELLQAANLAFEVRPPTVRQGAVHIFHQYVIRVPDLRDRLMNHLSTVGVATRVYYPVPLHLLECFSFLGYRKGDFPEAEAAALETMALPCFPELTAHEQDYVVDAIKEFSP
jgi:dTDP-4-amino-4,6-dideoxygalactose transaminase